MQILSLLIQISSSFIQNSSFFINNSSIIVDTNFIIFDNKFIIFTPASTGAPHGWRLKDSSFSMHNSSFFNAKLIVLNAEFIVFNTKFIICSTKFIIFNTKLTYQRAKHMHALRYVPGIKSCRRLLVFLLSRKDTFHTASRPSRHGMFSASCKKTNIFDTKSNISLVQCPNSSIENQDLYRRGHDVLVDVSCSTEEVLRRSGRAQAISQIDPICCALYSGA